MAIDNSFILQQILNEQSSTNDNLSAMREILADTLKLQQKNSKRRYGDGSDDPTPPPPGGGPGNRRRRRGPGGPRGGSDTGSGMFKNLFGEMKNFSRTALGNSASAANVVGSFGTSVNAVLGPLKALPGPVGAAATAFGAIVDVGMAVYEYMNDQLNMYNQLNSAGLTLRDGMLTARSAAAGSYMSLNDFNGALEKNSSSIAAMDGQYGDGVTHFAQLMSSVQDLQQANGIYGVSQQQLADLAAKNFKYEKLYTSQNALRSINQTQSTAEFVGQMTYLSKTVGKSVDELLGKFDAMGDSLDSTVSQYAMTDNWGFDSDKAAEVTKTMNSVYSSMGETGAALQKINASRLSLFQMPDEYNNNFLQSYADMMEDLQRSGTTDAKVVRETMSQYVKEHSSQLREELIAQQRSGNVQAAALLTQIQNQEKLFNDSNTNTNAQLEQYTNNFNIWISKTFTAPFNAMYTKLQLSSMKYLSDMADRSDGAFDMLANIASDAYIYLNNNFAGMFSLIADIPGKIMKVVLGDSYDKVAAAYNNMMSDMVQIPVRLGALIWDWLTGSDMADSGEKLKGSINSVFSDFEKYWDSIKDIKFNYSDMKTRIQDSFDSMKNAIAGWWDTAKGWFSSDDPVPEDAKKSSKNSVPSTPINTSTNQDPQQVMVGQNKPLQSPVIATPPSNKPEQISEDAKNSDNQTTNNIQPPPIINYDESILATLKAIASALDSSNSNNQQTSQLLRQISENTEASRHT